MAGWVECEVCGRAYFDAEATGDDDEEHVCSLACDELYDEVWKIKYRPVTDFETA